MTTAITKDSTKSETTAEAGPLVVDLGRKSKKQIRQARSGVGKLMNEVNGVLEDLRASGTVSATAQPVLIVVRQKRRKAKMGWPLG